MMRDKDVRLPKFRDVAPLRMTSTESVFDKDRAGHGRKYSAEYERTVSENQHWCSTPLVTDSWLSRLVESRHFNNFILVVIVINAIWIGFDTDYNPDNSLDSPAPQDLFYVVDHVFTTMFLLEIVIRFFSYRQWKSFFIDPRVWHWNLFDLVLVLLMVAEVWIFELYRFVSRQEKTVDMPKALQPLRLLRLLRITRIFRMLPELGMMVTSMVAALRSVYSTIALAACIMYVFSIIFTGWFLQLDPEDRCVTWVSGTIGHNEDVLCLEPFFGSIPKSLMTCGQLLIFDGVFSLIRPIFKVSGYIGFLMVLFLILAAFTVLNMLIGVICEIVCETTKEEKEKILRQQVLEAFAAIDVDASGSIDRDEFDGAARELLVPLGLDASSVERVFELIDIDGNGMLELDEFIGMVFKLLHPPESADLLLLTRKVDKLCEFMQVGAIRANVGTTSTPLSAFRGNLRQLYRDPVEPRSPASETAPDRRLRSSSSSLAAKKKITIKPSPNPLDDNRNSPGAIPDILDRLQQLLDMNAKYQTALEKQMHDVVHRRDGAERSAPVTILPQIGQNSRNITLVEEPVRAISDDGDDTAFGMDDSRLDPWCGCSAAPLAARRIASSRPHAAASNVEASMAAAVSSGDSPRDLPEMIPPIPERPPRKKGIFATAPSIALEPQRNVVFNVGPSVIDRDDIEMGE